MIDLKNISCAWLQQTHTHTQEKRSKTRQDWTARRPMTVYHCDEQILQSKNNKHQLSLTRRHKQFRSLEKTDEASKRWCWFLEQVALIISVICIRSVHTVPSCCEHIAVKEKLQVGLFTTPRITNFLFCASRLLQKNAASKIRGC